jgi:hypothetical protein
MLPRVTYYYSLLFTTLISPLSLQYDTNSIQGWCNANYMKFNTSETKVTSFSRKTNILIYHYKLRLSSVPRTDSIKDLRMFLDSKLHFHNHVNLIFSRCIKLLGIARSITFIFSSLECMHRLYITLVRSELEHASVVWNSTTSTDANKRTHSAEVLRPSVLIVSFLKSLALEEFNCTLYV